MKSDVSILVENKRISGWKSVEISRSIDAIAGKFNISMIDAWVDKDMPLEPGQTVSVDINKTQVINGYIDTVGVDTKKESNQLSISGRCKTCDLVDCSVVRDKNTWNNKDLLSIIKDCVDPFDIQIVNDMGSSGEKIKSVTINDGEKVQEVIEKLVKEKGVIAYGDSKGRLVLTTAGSEKATDKLIYGTNVLACSATFDFTNRYSWYMVKGQEDTEGDGWNKNSVSLFGETIDSGLPRYRPIIISSDSATTTSRAQKHADWEAQTRAGRSIKVNVTLQGWIQSDDSLWKENLVVYCDLPTLRIKGDLLINNVTYRQNDAGTICVLELCRADCYATPPPKEIKSKKKKSSWGGW